MDDALFQTASNDVRLADERCPWCGRDTTRANLVFDFIARDTYAVCSFCRYRLPDERERAA